MSVNFKNFYHGVHGVSRRKKTHIKTPWYSVISVVIFFRTYILSFPFFMDILHDNNTTMDIDDPRVEKNLDELTSILAKTGDPDFIKDLLRCLLTQAEIADIAARWALVKALKEKIPQRKIARDLGISLCKIVRGSRELKKPESAFQKIFTPGCGASAGCGAKELSS